jgi:aminotransferase
MQELSQVAKKVTPSPIRQMFNLAIGMEDVVSFTVGEPDFRTPDRVVEAAVTALRQGEHRYTPNAGILPLREAIAQQYTPAYDPAHEVIVTAGGMEALILTMMTILDPGDEMILADPCWTNYSRQILITSAVPVPVRVYAEDSFTYSPKALEAAITPKTKGFILNSPANPTGGVAPGDILEELAKIAVRHDLFVISDEVYNSIVYDGRQAVSIADFPGMRERTIRINSFSKTYAMTGWRVGWATGNESIIGNMVKLQESVAACVNSAAQYGALEALIGPQDDSKAMVESYCTRKDLVLQEFKTIPGLRCYTPEGTFYAFVDISATNMRAKDFATDLLQKARVIVVPGHAFGENSDQYIRLSFATSEQNIREGLRRIRQYMNQREEIV